MTATLLAIDTATDACSLALQLGGERRARHEVIPRQHQQRLFQLLGELLEGQPIAELGLDAIVFGCGPGSFTGLRIAASVAQGLAFSLGVPAVAVSTLEAQVHTYRRLEGVDEPCLVASTIDARIGQLYSAFYRCRGGEVEAVTAARLCHPGELALPQESTREPLPLHCVGTGFRDRAGMTPAFARAPICRPELLPEAQDMLGPGEARWRRGEVLPAAAALPDYVQERIGWKTLAEQGRRA